jgi:hypothetical protein
MAEPERVLPQEIYNRVKTGAALLVCAYDSEERFNLMRLDGAISLDSFKSRVPSLSKDQEIAFYCS